MPENPTRPPSPISSVGDEKLKILAAILAGVGALLMGYLTRLHFEVGGSSICDISAELSCEVVNKSVHSEILGVPVAVLGLLFFLSIPYLLYVKPLKNPWQIIALASLFSLIFGLYLSWIEYTVIRSVCLFCESSKVLILALGLVAIYAAKKYEKTPPKIWIFGTVFAGLLFSLITYLVQG